MLVGAEHWPIFASDLRTVVDIGANRGQFALAVRRWAPRAKVFAYEPLAGPAARFRVNIRLTPFAPGSSFSVKWQSIPKAADSGLTRACGRALDYARS